MSSNTTASPGGIGFLGALTLLFIGLKLGGVIDWSWVWVLAPLWMSWALLLGILLIAGLVILLRNASRKGRSAYRTADRRWTR